MKAHVRLLPSVLVLSLTVVLFGCGGGGGGDDDDGGAAGSATGPAPQSISGTAMRLFDQSGPESRIEFAATGNQFVQADSMATGITRTGTYAYAPAGSSATLTLVDTSNDEIRTVTLTFSNSEAGSYQASSNTGARGSGAFNLVAGTPPAGTPPPPPPESGGNQNPNPNPDPGTGTDPGNGTPAPIGEGGLDGRTLSMTRSTGQTHTYSFTGNRFIDSDPPEQGSGTYSFTRNGTQGMLILHYTGSTGPVNLAGDRHELNLTFSSDIRGTYTSTYTVSDGTVLPQNGVFEVIR